MVKLLDGFLFGVGVAVGERCVMLAVGWYHDRTIRNWRQRARVLLAQDY